MTSLKAARLWTIISRPRYKFGVYTFITVLAYVVNSIASNIQGEIIFLPYNPIFIRNISKVGTMKKIYRVLFTIAIISFVRY